MSQSTKPTFAFLLHPRTMRDVFKTYPFFRFVPERLVKFIIRVASPIHVLDIKGLPRLDGQGTADGIVISVGMVGGDLLKDRVLGAREVEKALRFAKKKGVHIVGLGALTSPLMGGGVDAVGKYGVHVTNGIALTAAITILDIRKILKERTLEHVSHTVAVVGATGSIGSAISQMIGCESGVTRVILIGRTPENLERLKEKSLSRAATLSCSASVEISTNIEFIRDADVVIVATSADGAVITPSLLKQGALVYDITQPKNVPEDLVVSRPDVTLIDGALARVPDSVKIRSKIFSLPPQTVFSCLAETMILAAMGYDNDFSIGPVEVKNVEYIIPAAERYHVVSARPD